MSPENRSNEATVKRVKDTRRRMNAALIGSAKRLDEPFTDRPELSPWSLSIKPAQSALSLAIDDVVSALAAVERERDELRERLGECIGCNYNDGPDECCPQHGRTITEWIDIASTVIGRQHAIEAERDAAIAANARLLARIAAVEAREAELRSDVASYARALMLMRFSKYRNAEGWAWLNAEGIGRKLAVLAASPTSTGPTVEIGGQVMTQAQFAAARQPLLASDPGETE